MTTNKKTTAKVKSGNKKKDNLVSTFFNEWSDVIKNLKFDDENKRTDNKIRDDYEFQVYNTQQKIINDIWAWWNTKPQKRKNSTTIRVITKTDIEELVNMLKEVD